MFKLLKKKRGGFTLIELLVVVAVIGILASVILVGVAAFRGRARDSRRLQDLSQIQNALELCFTKKGSYPTALSGLLSDTDCNIGLSQLPKDPSDSSSDYAYCSSGSPDVNRYVLGTLLEERVKALDDMLGGAFPCDPGATSGRNSSITCETGGTNKHYCKTI